MMKSTKYRILGVENEWEKKTNFDLVILSSLNPCMCQGPLEREGSCYWWVGRILDDPNLPFVAAFQRLFLSYIKYHIQKEKLFAYDLGCPLQIMLTSHTAKGFINSFQKQYQLMLLKNSNELMYKAGKPKCFRPILPVMVEFENGLQTYALLDSGSNRTVMTDAFASKVGCRMKEEKILVQGLCQRPLVFERTKKRKWTICLVCIQCNWQRTKD